MRKSKNAPEVALSKVEKATLTKTRPYDAARYLNTPEEMAMYLEACIDLADGDATLIAHALGDIARAQGMTNVATKAGLSRESLYKALSGERTPSFATIMKVVGALGMTLGAKPAKKTRSARARTAVSSPRAARPREESKSRKQLARAPLSVHEGNMKKPVPKDRHSYSVTWSEEDGEHVGLCAQLPSLSWLARSPESALRGIRWVVADVLSDIKNTGEQIL